MRTVPLTFTALFLAMAFAPLAMADHYDDANGQDLRFWAGVTYEDDGAFVNYPTNPLHDTANKVVAVGREPGDGSLFLDAFLNQQRGVEGPYSPFYAPYAGNRMMPGYQVHAARFGWWSDLDTDGVIDDNHDASGSVVDEFKWKGSGSGDTSQLLGWAVPSNTYWGSVGFATRFWATCPADAAFPALDYLIDGTPPTESVKREYNCAASLFGANHDGSYGGLDTRFTDRTAHSNGHQSYVADNGWETPYTDDGLLVTTYTVVVAQPGRTLEGDWDISVPAALVDVDEYESVDPSLESLYLSMWAAAGANVHAASDAAWAPVPGVMDAVNDIDLSTPVDEIVVGLIEERIIPVIEDAENAGANAMDLGNNPEYVAAFNMLYSPYAVEPNTPEDVYPGASFGAPYDLVGTGNDYGGFNNNWGFFGDARAEVRMGMIANANLGPAGAVGSEGDVYDAATGLNQDILGTSLGWQYLDPFGATGDSDKRSAIPKMGFVGEAYAWNDKNGDGWVGTRCDPMDAEPCAYNNGARSSPGGFGGGEVAGLCGLTSLSTGTFTLTPVGGDWPSVLVLRWYSAPTRNIWEDPNREYTTELVMDDSPITIRWDPEYFNCDGDAVGTRAADEIWFPRGSGGISVRMEATIDLEGAYTTETGVTIPAGASFTDVDYYVAGL